MYRLVLSISLFLIAVSGLRSQEAMDFNHINSESYRLYLAEEWDSLISLGKEARKQEIDFYYLRMRMGIALYSQDNYLRASGHFKKALEFNQADPVALEYLYYSLLFSGQPDRAALVRKQFKGDLALRLPPQKGKFFDRTGAEYFYCRGLNEELVSDPDPLFSDLPPGIQYISRSISNTSINLSNRIAPGIRLNHSFTYLKKINFQYYNDGYYLFYLEDQQVKQYQYYFSPAITTLSGITFTPAFHLLSIYTQVPETFSQGYQGGNSSVTMGYYDILDYVGGLEVSYKAGTLDLKMGAWYSSLSMHQLVQNRLGLDWYPLGNLKLYMGAGINTQYDLYNSTAVFRIIPELRLGASLAEKVWIDLNMAMGEMTNFLEQNGYIVFNSFSDVMHKKVGLVLSVPLSEKGSLAYLGGRWTTLESGFYPFDPVTDATTNIISYNDLSIYGGLSWKF